MGNKSKRTFRMPAGLGASEGKIGRAEVAIQSADGLQIQTAGLETPSQLYDADVAWVEGRGPSVSLFFGKASYPQTIPPSLSSRLEIRYSPEAFNEHLWRNSRQFHDTLQKGPVARALVEDRGLPIAEPRTLHAEKSHSMWANFELMSHAGGEGCIDFYHMDPRSIASYVRNHDTSLIRISPVVRVLLPSVELLAVLNACGAIAGSMAARSK